MDYSTESAGEEKRGGGKREGMALEREIVPSPSVTPTVNIAGGMSGLNESLGGGGGDKFVQGGGGDFGGGGAGGGADGGDLSMLCPWSGPIPCCPSEASHLLVHEAMFASGSACVR
jgi:hypothetical protein